MRNIIIRDMREGLVLNNKRNLALYLYMFFVVGFFIFPERVHKDWLLYLTSLSSLFLFPRTDHTKKMFQDLSFKLTLVMLLFLAISYIWANTFEWEDYYKPFALVLCIFAIIMATVNLVCEGNKKFIIFIQKLPKCALLFSILSIGYFVITAKGPLLSTGFDGWLGLGNRVHGSVLIFCLSIPLLFAMLNDKKPLWFVCVVMLPFFIYGAISQARMAVLAYMIFFSFILIINRPRESLGYGTAVLILAYVAGSIIDFTPLIEVVMQRGGSYRLEIWQAVFDHYSTNCNVFFGCGHGNEYSVQVGKHEFDRAHSIFLAQLYFGGIIGATLFFTWLVVIMSGLKKQQNDNQISWQVALLYVMFASLTSGDAILMYASTMWLAIWFPVAMIIAYRIKGKISTNLIREAGA